MSKTEESRYCRWHNDETLQVYCDDCRTLSCAICQSLDHHDHVTRDVIDLAEERRCLLDDAITIIRSKLSEFSDAHQELGQRQIHYLAEREDVLRHICRCAELQKSLIDRKTEILREEIEILFKRQQEHICDVQEAVTSQLPELKTLLQRCEQCFNTTPASDLVLEFDELDWLPMVFDDLTLFRIDHDSISSTVRHPLPQWEDFLQWNASEFFGVADELGDSTNEDEVSEALDMWRNMKRELEEISVSTTDQRSAASESVMSTAQMEQELLHLRQQLDRLLEVANGLEQQLEKEIGRSSSLAESLREIKQAERRMQAEGSDSEDETQQLEDALARVNRLIYKQDKNTLKRLTLRKVTREVNIAVIGITGVGKSSFINAIRGLTADDVGAAQVGVKETTTIVTAYTHPDNPRIKFWDLPGVGTDRFPKSEYLSLVQVDRFDFFIVISATRFYENDTWLVKEISRRGKKFFFVRTKVEVDIRGNRKAHPRTHNEVAVVENIRYSTVEHLEQAGQPAAEVFLIDSYAPQKYDFELLCGKLVNDLPAGNIVDTGQTTVTSTGRCVIS